MPDYETLRILWWLILGALLIGFAITDGFDLGVAAIFRFIGRNDDERRALLEAIEPVWEGNQVWFVLGAGAVFAAWPLLYAAAFSELYLAVFLLLVCFILRPVGFNFRDKIADPAWRGTWDWVLTLAGLAPALLFGVVFGNLFLGVDFDFDALLRPVVAGSFFSLLHPFALLVGLVSLSMLVLHGASYAAHKVGAPMASRASIVAVGASILFVIAFIAAGAWISTGIGGQRILAGAGPSGPSDPLLKHVVVVPGGWLRQFRAHPVLWLAPGLALLGAALAAGLQSAGKTLLAFLGSALTQAATILTAGIALFPFLLPSATHPDHGLTVWDASSSARTLSVMLVAAMVFMPAVIAYTGWVYRVLRGRITLEHLRGQRGLY
jgi:cytochrome d ubiquinol oxidase subunit II